MTSKPYILIDAQQISLDEPGDDLVRIGAWDAGVAAFVKSLDDFIGCLTHQPNPEALTRDETATSRFLTIWRDVTRSFDAYERRRASLPPLPVSALKSAMAEGADPNALTSEDVLSVQKILRASDELAHRGNAFRALDLMPLTMLLIDAGWLYPFEYVAGVLQQTYPGYELVLNLGMIQEARDARWVAEARCKRAGEIATPATVRRRARA